MKLDPFVVEVIRHGLSAAAEEMSLVMTRSARSPLLREAGDLSSAITDAPAAVWSGRAATSRSISARWPTPFPELLKVVPVSDPERRRRADLQCRRARRQSSQRRQGRASRLRRRRDRRLRGQPCALARYRRHLARQLFRQGDRHLSGGDADSAGADRNVSRRQLRRSCSCSRPMCGIPNPARAICSRQIAATKAGERRIVELCREHGKACLHGGAIAPARSLRDRDAGGAPRPARWRLRGRGLSRRRRRERRAGPHPRQDHYSPATKRPSTCPAAATASPISATPRRSLRAPRWPIRRAS